MKFWISSPPALHQRQRQPTSADFATVQVVAKPSSAISAPSSPCCCLLCIRQVTLANLPNHTTKIGQQHPRRPDPLLSLWQRPRRPSPFTRYRPVPPCRPARPCCPSRRRPPPRRLSRHNSPPSRPSPRPPSPPSSPRSTSPRPPASSSRRTSSATSPRPAFPRASRPSAPPSAALGVSSPPHTTTSRS